MDPKGEILVVDDTPESLRLLADLLLTEGYRVRPTMDPKLALESALANPPELILLDVKMPGMDGFELCQRLKQETCTEQVPIIFVSALQELRERVRGFEAGGVDFITKPIQREEVLARVSAQLELSRMRQSLEKRSQELAAANQKLQDLDKLKSLFIASVSHELRTPLNAIISFSGILLREILGGLNERQRDSLERIDRAGRHLFSLITDVIDISKIEAGRSDVYPETFGLQELVEEALNTIRPQAEAKGLTVTVSVSAVTWPVLHTDRRRLLQCLVNLLGNAVKFTEEGGATVLVSDTGEAVEIAVRDTGIGIAEGDLSKLFKAFERLDSHLRVKAGGTGLGLYLTRKLVTDFLNGEISVDSQHGEGSTFCLTVPKVIVSTETLSEGELS
ncbi:response regulator [Desulfoluna sp.]|uniref:ATP-binding response regulator n=1 Tax=Desulfoluna sp. TaxID=2045199 RepID=UPI00261E89D0|nr:response regulator [Desulfoluna sp.]